MKTMTSMLLPDASQLVSRLADAEDLAAVEELHDRCAPETIHRRYCGRRPSGAALRRLVSPDSGFTLVTMLRGKADGSMVAMANLVGEGDQAEAAVLVHESWQRRGIGTVMLRRLLALAGHHGFDAVVLHILADNEPMLRTVRRLDCPVRMDWATGMVDAVFATAGQWAEPAARGTTLITASGQIMGTIES